MNAFVKNFLARISPATAAALLGLAAVSATGAEAVRRNQSVLANAPLYFEADGAGHFVGRGSAASVVLAPNEATLVLAQPAVESAGNPQFRSRSGTQNSMEARAVRIRLEGANAAASMTGLETMAARANYFVGNDPAAWRTAVPLFSRVQVDDVYPGVSMVYYAEQSARLEYDFVLAPFAGADQIRFRVDGADQVRVDASGDLVLTIGGDEVRQHKPVIYQDTAGGRKEIAGGYRRNQDGTIGFQVSAYDRSRPLVIDPVLSMGTFVGGAKGEFGWGIALDSAKNIYVVGETLSTDFIPLLTRSGFTNHIGFTNQTKFGGGTRLFGDAFIAKYADDGSNIYLSYFGGKTDDGALAVAVDTDGNAYVTGFTDSTNFPILPRNPPTIKTNLNEQGARNNNPNRLFPVDAFVAKFNPDGSLNFSTFLGGSRREEGTTIAVDDNTREVYVAGLTESTNFPATAGVFQPANGCGTNNTGPDAFVAEIGPYGTNLVYATYLGGKHTEYAQGIALQTNGAVWVTGFTSSPDFPINNTLGSLTNMYDYQQVVKVGGVKITNIITVTNITTFTNLNRSTATNASGRFDAFISKIDPLGASLPFSAFFGGSNDDAGMSITLDGAGNAFATGFTTSTDYPTNIVPSPYSGASNFLQHVFVTAVLDSGSSFQLGSSLQFGGSLKDQGMDIALDSLGNVFVTGFTSSTNFFAAGSFTNLVSTNVPAKKSKIANDAFLAILTGGSAAYSPSSLILRGSGDDQANGLVYDESTTTAYLVGTTTSTNLATPNAWQTLPNNGKKGKVTDAFVSKIEDVVP